MSNIIEFTTDEVDILALGWHEALLISRIPDCPKLNDGTPLFDYIMLLDRLTHSGQGVLRETVEQSVQALQLCAGVSENYAIKADSSRDAPHMQDIIYLLQQDSEIIRRRFADAVQLLKRKLG